MLSNVEAQALTAFCRQRDSGETMSFTEANRTTDMNGRNSAEYAADDSVDIIHIIQERDAYKQETEKLRKIIERQRFIIKSLQEQIARKQSVSGTSTPTAANADALPDTASHSATGTPRLAPSVESTARAGAERISNGASNALGLSSLSVKTPTKGVSTMRKVSQNSSLGSPLPPVAEGRESLDESSEAANLRPWAKSTRLSEIYADYSARHNSVSPMFKPPSGAWPANGADPQSHQRMRSTSGSSFTESLKASIRRTEWPTEWGAHNESGYASDRSAGGRSASAVGDDSRRPSLATDSQRQQPAPASTQPKHDSAFGHVGGAQTIGAAVADADVERRFDTQIPDPASEQPSVPAGAGQSVPSISRSVSDSSSIAPSTPLPAVPARLNDGAAGQSPSEVMVLRPVSMAVPQPVANGKHAAAPIQEDSEAWRPEEVDRYEYDMPAAGVDSRAGHSLDATRQQQPMQPMQEQPTQPSASRARVPSPSFGPGPGVEKSVTWEVADEEPATHAVSVPGLASQPSARSVAESSSSQRSDKSSAQALNDAFINQPALTSLENIDVQIKDSRVKIDERGKEVSVYMIDIVFRREVSGFSLHEMIVDAQQPAIVVWTVEKRYSDFAALHSSLRQALSKERSHEKLERLPEKEIFRANAPTKNDRRKQWFEKYLKRALKLDLRDQSALLQFLSTNRTVDAEKSMPILLGHKEGFLVKKGKNFGGWKRRYYVCNANKPVLEYYESPGGSINGSISLAGAVVKTGRAQSRPSAKDSDMIRHAFLIEEQPRREGKDPVFHPLWADSERERDEWVMALRYVIVRESEGPERAMREVERFVSYTKRKESGALMIQQFQTSITHEHGARRSIEYNRRREEQRDASAKTASPLSNQAWPATHDDRDASPRPQSFPPGHASGSESDLEPPRPLRLDSARSPVLAATLSTSFSGGFGGESLASQAERMSIHYVPSDISTMESSRSSSHTGGGGGERGGGGRGSYASTADDTTGAAYGFGHGAVAAAALGPVASAADSPLTGTHPSDGCSVPASASVQPQPQAQAQPRHPFTKNAVGRIVHEEEAAPELP
ncbi:Rho GTPase activating protein, partial [Coemansia sp. RSA 485]